LEETCEQKVNAHKSEDAGAAKDIVSFFVQINKPYLLTKSTHWYILVWPVPFA
jgi:hypothetical protein